MRLVCGETIISDRVDVCNVYAILASAGDGIYQLVNKGRVCAEYVMLGNKVQHARFF